MGENLDRRVVPLTVGDVSVLSRTLARSQLYDANPERDRVTALLSEEAEDLAQRSTYRDVVRGMALQYESLHRMLRVESSATPSVRRGSGARTRS